MKPRSIVQVHQGRPSDVLATTGRSTAAAAEALVVTASPLRQPVRRLESSVPVKRWTILGRSTTRQWNALGDPHRRRLSHREHAGRCWRDRVQAGRAITRPLNISWLLKHLDQDRFLHPVLELRRQVGLLNLLQIVGHVVGQRRVGLRVEADRKLVRLDRVRSP